MTLTGNASFTASPPGAWPLRRWKPSLPNWAGIWGRSLLIARRRKLQPYSVAPWAEERADPSLPPILKALRGDFFCLPFGGNATPFRGEKHPVHGETANARWQFRSLETAAGRTLPAPEPRGRRFARGGWTRGFGSWTARTSLYSQHVVSGMSGPMNLGHHAMLKFPDAPGSGLVSTSRFVYGQVFPQAFELPEKRGYSWLKPGAEFKSLAKVPTITGETTDLTRYPARRGFEDLVMLVSDAKAPFAWTAVTFPKERYVWFALKDPRVLRETVFWLSNGGRHYPPWNGRHVNVHGAGRSDLLLSPWSGGVRAQEPPLRKGVSHLPGPESQEAARRALHHGRGQNPGGI